MKTGKMVIIIVACAIGIASFSYVAGPLFYDVTVNEEMPNANISNLMGTFVGVDDGIHDATGDVILIESDDGSKYLRFENFEATNGPDLHVYLSTDTEASDFINLGRLKGNIGNQNYLIPPGAELSKYSTVLIWCKQFSVLFGSAELF